MGKATITGGGNDGLYTAQKSYHDGLKGQPESMWCADLTEDLSGDVGSCEVPNENSILLRPGYSGRAVYNPSRDGMLKRSDQMNAPRFFHSLAMQPGWQKWKPTYRFATISNIDTDLDTCSISIISSYSRVQGLSTDYKGSFSNVPVEYMECNSAAFENGDTVLVEFSGQDLNAPKVIGFKTNPKSCGGFIENWYGPSPNSYNDWRAQIYLRWNYDFYPFSPRSYYYEEDPWIASIGAVPGGTIAFEEGDAENNINGTMTIERDSPAEYYSYDGGFQWVVAEIASPFEVKNGALDITIDEVSTSINTNTGDPVYVKLQCFTTEGGGLGAFNTVFSYNIDSVGAFEGIDASALIGQHLSHVSIACIDYGVQSGPAIGPVQAKIRYVKIS